jgi:hypothetical protein
MVGPNVLEKGTFGIQSLAILVVWTIWRERNVRIFEKVEKQPCPLVGEIKDTAKLWVLAGARKLSTLVGFYNSQGQTGLAHAPNPTKLCCLASLCLVI